jgi:hypothetical protein
MATKYECIPNGRNIIQLFSFLGPPEFNKIWIFGLKTHHLAAQLKTSDCRNGAAAIKSEMESGLRMQPPRLEHFCQCLIMSLQLFLHNRNSQQIARKTKIVLVQLFCRAVAGFSFKKVFTPTLQ